MYLIIFMFVTYIIQIALVIFRENFAEVFNGNYAKGLYQKMYNMKYDKLLSLETTYIVERIGQAVDALYMFISNSFVSIVSNSIIILISLIILGSIDIYLALILFLLLPLNYLGYKAINKRLHAKSMAMQEETAAGYKEIISVFKNIDHIKQEESFANIENLISHSLDKIYKSRSSVNKFGQSTSLIIKLINNFVQNLMFLWLGFMVVANESLISDLVIVSIIFPIYFTAIQSLINVNLEVRDLHVSREFIKNELEGNIEDDSAALLDEIKEIDFHDVSYYIGDHRYHFPIHAAFKKGDIVFVKGPSGVGKSSLMKLLLKYRVGNGIEINQQDINTFNNSALRSKVFYLSQDFTLLPMSIKDNILFGKDGSKVDWEKLKISDLLASVLASKTLDSDIYEFGTNLSGGEKQRIMSSKLLIEEFDVVRMKLQVISIKHHRN
ncbi:ATP-binding cassette domain-containing protein [Virgibacillus dakarensis]|uniref:ATP-binding cassette domain-containing protein n=1 Tax=Virgibacillus dakarensis TaxID=1917889 RepID=UPI000B453CC5|nr:ABC transporter ATP-binding protein [Virgibacillus dakarensis]